MPVGLSLLLWRLGLGPIYAWLISMNTVTVLLYGYDKRQAVVGGIRVPEAALHMAALLGGSPGAAVAQGLFRHKTRKLRFKMTFAAIVLLQIAAGYGYWRLVYNK
jgi:uncharacterized membrane protein YsdA (DUF1294 family)